MVEEFESVMDVADSLMTVEDLTWASLFHLRYLCAGRLMKLSELDHIKAVTEVASSLSFFTVFLLFIFSVIPPPPSVSCLRVGRWRKITARRASRRAS